MKFNNTRFITLSSIIVIAVVVFATPALARWRDGTGPEGRGPLTGRGAGYCTANDVSAAPQSAVPGRGIGRANYRAGGRGYRNIYRTTGLTRWQRVSAARPVVSVQQESTKEQRLEILKKQTESLMNELERITLLIKDIESEE
jgi:hypothetical protein